MGGGGSRGAAPPWSMAVFVFRQVVQWVLTAHRELVERREGIDQLSLNCESCGGLTHSLLAAQWHRKSKCTKLLRSCLSLSLPSSRSLPSASQSNHVVKQQLSVVCTVYRIPMFAPSHQHPNNTNTTRSNYGLANTPLALGEHAWRTCLPRLRICMALGPPY